MKNDFSKTLDNYTGILKGIETEHDYKTAKSVAANLAKLNRDYGKDNEKRGIFVAGLFF